MKKSILLIAPLTLLISCTGSSEIFDDAYNDAKAPTVTKVDEEGYADHIKEQEKDYPVVVEESASEGRNMDGINPSYYGNNPDGDGHYHNGYNGYANQGSDGYGAGYRGYNNWYNHNFGGPMVVNNYYMGMNRPYCQYTCMSWRNSGSCWHIDRYYNNGYYGMPGQHHYVVFGTNDPYAPNGWYGVGGYDPYSNGYFNNYNYYNGYYGYCGNNFYNNYYYGNNYWSPYGNYGWGPYWGYNGLYAYNFYNNGSNNNWSNVGNQDNPTNSGNHHYGHRGGSNSGSNSQNNSTYEHTVHAPVNTSTPFVAYQGADLTSSSEISSMPSNNTIGSKPATNVGNTVNSQPAKPDHVNTYSTSEKPGSFSSSKPTGAQNDNEIVNNPANSNNTFTGNTTSKPVNTTSKPANTNNNFVSKGKPANNQFAPKTVSTYSTSGREGTTNSGNSGRTYDNPNKYGVERNNDRYNGTNPGTSYGSGTNNSNNRRTYNSGSSGNRSGSYNSGGSNRSSGSTYSGNRSSGSSSSSSGSSSRSSGSSGSGGSSRRR